MAQRPFEGLSRPLEKDHSYEDDTTEPGSGSESGSERPRRNSQGSGEVEIRVQAMAFSRRRPQDFPWVLKRRRGARLGASGDFGWIFHGL